MTLLKKKNPPKTPINYPTEYSKLCFWRLRTLRNKFSDKKNWTKTHSFKQWGYFTSSPKMWTMPWSQSFTCQWRDWQIRGNKVRQRWQMGYGQVLPRPLSWSREILSHHLRYKLSTSICCLGRSAIPGHYCRVPPSLQKWHLLTSRKGSEKMTSVLHNSGGPGRGRDT